MDKYRFTHIKKIFEKLGRKAAKRYGRSTWIDGIFYKLSTLSEYSSETTINKMMGLYGKIAFNVLENSKDKEEIMEAISQLSLLSPIELKEILLSFLKGYHAVGGEKNE